MFFKINKHRRRLDIALTALIVGAGALVSSCDTDEFLDVEDLEVSFPQTLEDPGSAAGQFAGALGDFQSAFNNGDAFVNNVANFTDEFRISDTFITRQATDRRDQLSPQNGNTTDGAYNALHRARRSARIAAGNVGRFVNATDPRIAELNALEGFTYVLLGEGWCGHIPFSDVNTFRDEPGAPLSTAETFTAAVAKFDAALAIQGTNNLARVGRGRALLNNGRFAEAAAAVAAVPTTFIYTLQHNDNTGRQENGVWNLNISNRRYTVSDREGTNGLPFRTAQDVRVPFRDQGRNGFDGVTRLFENLRYPERGSDIFLADGVEARLIEAEAALQAGNTDLFLTRLNDLRANARALMIARIEGFNNAVNVNAQNFVNNAAALAPLTDPGTQAGRVDLLFRERAFWLYTTGHRLGDLRRLIRQYGRTQDTVFPIGPYHKGGAYGADVNFPVPFDEENNAKFQRAQCDTKRA